ncbi:hypothetical protein THSYN_27330 [Candidatus Thiodictyon syntrophicum]|uniref:Uncharacterized protein n=1 Tax=Candidatus Thiodictyon syntrophicum TaxID=1166950 RepID=A0A2K8UFE6_9GAMM|nr:hypothetical protein THSYN_27330 [Candidatus Thiodictyon syntrophicum]
MVDRLLPGVRMAFHAKFTDDSSASIMVPAPATGRSAPRPTAWERRTPVRPGPSAARDAADA